MKNNKNKNPPPGTCPGPKPCPGNNPDGPNGVICLDPGQDIPAPIPPHAAAAAANALKGVGRIGTCPLNVDDDSICDDLSKPGVEQFSL